jgi:hypothetical protein
MSNTFTGLKSACPVVDPEEPFYRGSTCIHKEHAGVSGDALTWRDSRTHACLECCDRIERGHLCLDLNQFSKSVQTTAARFWNAVHINEWDECWQWTGDIAKNRRLFFYWRRPGIASSYKIHPIHAMNWLTRGDIGRLGTRTLCGERRCVNPLHQLPIGLDIQDPSKEYLEYQRNLLIQQLTERAKPDFKQKEEMYPNLKDTFAYERALHQLSVRQL